MARVLVGDSFGGDAQGRNARMAEVVEAVAQLYEEKLRDGSANPTVTVAELANYLGKVQTTVRRWLKPALDHGWVEERAPAVGKKGAEYIPGKPMPDLCPLPSVEELAEAFPDLARGFSVIDPLTGEKLALEPEEVAHEIFQCGLFGGAPLHNKALSYEARYGLCGAKLVHHKITKPFFWSLVYSYRKFVEL